MDGTFKNELICEQRSKEWFAARLGKITGSKFDDLMPATMAKVEQFTQTQEDILIKVASEILTGEREESGFLSKDMQNGIDREPFALKAYENHELLEVRECGFFTISEYLGSSPDGVIEITKESWETKCPKNTTHTKYFNNPYLLFKKYKWQCVGEAWAIGYKKGVICSFNPKFSPDKQLVIYKFEVTPEDLAFLQTRLNVCIAKIKKIVEKENITVSRKES